MSAPVKSNTPVPARALAYFELAVSLYLWQWQALSLAVENEWGGPDSSDKRDWLAGVLADMFTVPLPLTSSSNPASSPSSSSSSTVTGTTGTTAGTAGTTGTATGSESRRMATAKQIEPEDIEDVAVQVIEDEFSVVVEDDSAYDLGVQITGAWKKCLLGDFSTIDALHAAFKSARPGLGGKQQQQQQQQVQGSVGVRAEKRSGAESGSESESSGTDAEVDDDEGESQAAQSGDAMDIDSQHQHQQHHEPHPRVVPATKPQPVVDEDGFELVQPRQKHTRQR